MKNKNQNRDEIIIVIIGFFVIIFLGFLCIRAIIILPKSIPLDEYCIKAYGADYTFDIYDSQVYSCKLVFNGTLTKKYFTSKDIDKVWSCEKIELLELNKWSSKCEWINESNSKNVEGGYKK